MNVQPEPSSRTCKKCGLDKPIEEFRRFGTLWRRTECYDCLKEICRLRSAKRYKENPQKYRDIQNAYHARRRQGIVTERTVISYEEARLRYRANSKKRNRELKAEVLAAYGGICVCCGETEPLFLTIDHVANDGAEHRQTIKEPFYRYLKKAGFPQDGYQVLCFNCNLGKYYNGGACPHHSHQ